MVAVYPPCFKQILGIGGLTLRIVYEVWSFSLIFVRVQTKTKFDIQSWWTISDNYFYWYWNLWFIFSCMLRDSIPRLCVSYRRMADFKTNANIRWGARFQDDCFFPFLKNWSASVFSCGHATLTRLRPSVGRCVRPSVRNHRVEKWETAHFRPCPPVCNWYGCVSGLVFFIQPPQRGYMQWICHRNTAKSRSKGKLKGL